MLATPLSKSHLNLLPQRLTYQVFTVCWRDGCITPVGLPSVLSGSSNFISHLVEDDKALIFFVPQIVTTEAKPLSSLAQLFLLFY